MPKEKPESFCLWACAISKSPFPRGVSHFTIIISGVKLSNGWNREVLHIVKIWCLLCKSYCPFEYERGLKRPCVPFISQSTHQRHFGKWSDLENVCMFHRDENFWDNKSTWIATKSISWHEAPSKGILACHQNLRNTQSYIHLHTLVIWCIWTISM